MAGNTERNNLTATEEQELSDSEIRYRRLFEAARDGILILDAETRKITDVNPFMIELLDYTREEFLDKELWEIGLLKDEEASAAAFRELQEKHYIRYEDLPLENKFVPLSIFNFPIPQLFASLLRLSLIIYDVKNYCYRCFAFYGWIERFCAGRTLRGSYQGRNRARRRSSCGQRPRRALCAESAR